MTDITSIFGGAYEPNKYVEPPEVQLADAMRAAGLDPPSNIRIDGNCTGSLRRGVRGTIAVGMWRFQSHQLRVDSDVGVIKLTLFSTLKCSVNSHLTS